MSTRKRSPRCLRCQERHVKCDKAKPTCSSCRSLKYPAICEYASRHLRFRQSRYSSALARNNAASSEKSPPEIDLANEDDLEALSDARCVFRGHAGHLHSDIRADIPRFSSTAHTTEAPVRRTSQPCSITSSPKTSLASGPRQTILPQPPVSTLALSTVGVIPADSPYGIRGSLSSVDLSQSSVTAGFFPQETSFRAPPEPPRTLTKELDCRVFAFYVEHAGKWIDIGSPGGYFQSYVPRLALRNSLLLTACLSCASNLMYLLGMIDKKVEQDYSDQVVSLMIPLLSSESANSSNEALLATVVILRMSEQFLELSSDAQRHLRGAASLFLDGTDWSPTESNLAISCFWTYMRESIRISFLQERPCPFELSHLSLHDDDMTTPAPDDGVWTNRITYLLVQVSSLCWGQTQTQQRPTDRSRKLNILIDNWKAHLPPSFQPWCACERDAQPFPDIRVFTPWHVVAWQFYYTAKVLLAVHYPDIRASQSLHSIHRYIEAAIVAPTRLLCGLCISNTTNVGTNLNGSHLMAWCGRFLSGRAEQKCLLEFLTEFSQNTKWPSGVDCTRLEESWTTSVQPWINSIEESPET
ncbi:hypothetical protein BDV59DRAFT_16099 [Aspergillus ambiguus]|uniref:Zn(II)2Cys6 transcription factor n=1 Tax=Aspergillus ambiguus TaxID=176160 RepID=UPI003CCC98EB